MTFLTSILLILSGLLHIDNTPRFNFECRQIGDNAYTCDGGRQ